MRFGKKQKINFCFNSYWNYRFPHGYCCSSLSFSWLNLILFSIFTGWTRFPIQSPRSNRTHQNTIVNFVSLSFSSIPFIIGLSIGKKASKHVWRLYEEYLCSRSAFRQNHDWKVRRELLCRVGQGSAPSHSLDRLLRQSCLCQRHLGAWARMVPSNSTWSLVVL